MKFNPPKRIQQTVSSQKIFIDIRQEIEDLFHGTSSSPGFSFEVIVRKVDKSQRCHCWDPLKEEANGECKYCSGSGFLTKNIIVPTVKKKFVGKELWTDIGQMESDTAIFYFKHNLHLTEEDTIIEVVTDDNGKLADRNNYEIIKKFSIRDLEIYRGNNGRTEFSRCYCSKSE